jgi:hypothetical protein
VDTLFRYVKQNLRTALASREGRTTTACQCLALLVLLAIGQGPLRAARIGPDPLFAQLEQGYGVIAAIVEKPSPLHSSETRFRVEEILAQSVIGDRIPAKKGTTIDLHLSVGYGMVIEDIRSGSADALAPGNKYILTVKYDKQSATYEHAPGASCAQRVTSFSPESRKFYRIIHEIARQPADRRVKRCRELVVNAKAGSFVDARLRSEALAWLARRAKNSADKGATGRDVPTKSEGNETFDLLFRVWKDATVDYTMDELVELDYFLRAIRRSFDNSADRREVWLRRLFAPVPGEGSRDDIRTRVFERMRFGDSMLRDLAKEHPILVGSHLVKELKSNNWPMLFRIYIATVLHGLYEFQIIADPRWDKALQTFYEKAIATADADDLDLLLRNLSPNTRDQRREEWRLFKPKFPLEARLQKALERMRAEEKKEKSEREVIRATIRGIEELLQELKKAREAK